MNHSCKSLVHRFEKLLFQMELNSDRFVKCPGKDFSRNRKLSFSKLIFLFVSIEGNTLSRELRHAFKFSSDHPSPSAFCQRRAKLLPSALPQCFKLFTESFPCSKRFHGYRLIACDGSAIACPYNPSDASTFVQNNSNSRGCNLIHLSAFYDLCEKQYVDAVLSFGNAIHESADFITMLKRFPDHDPAIFIADRGYESYNAFAHLIQEKRRFVFRVKAPDSNKILHGLDLPVGIPFDLTMDFSLAAHVSKRLKSSPLPYHILKKGHFDFFDQSPDAIYPFHLRFVSVPLANGSFEYLITNLDSKEFSSQMLFRIYALRWGIETSFRDLKYTIGLTNFHSKKAEFICQEIFARMILFNLCQLFVASFDFSRTTFSRCYVLNFTDAVDVFRHMLSLSSTESPPDALGLLRRNLHTSDPERTFHRNVRTRTAVSFFYRVP